MVVHAHPIEPSSKALGIAVWVSVFVASAVFASAGLRKLGGDMIGQFEEWGYVPSFAIAIGVLELVGAIGLLLPRCSAQAALGLIVIMFGAIGTHVLDGDYIAALLPTLMLALLGFVLFGRGLRATAG
jgi:putative oxidoreductase